MKDQNAALSFVINHAEKAVLAGVLGIFGFLVYTGFSMEPFRDGTPTDLTSRANSAKKSLESDHWDAIKDDETRVFEAIYSTRTDATRSRLAPNLDFGILTPPPGKALTKRKDPGIENPDFAPKSIEMHSVLGSLLVTLEGKSAISGLEHADAIEIEEEKPKRPAPRRRRPRGGGAGGYPGGGGEGGGYPGGGGEMEVFGGGDEGGEGGMFGGPAVAAGPPIRKQDEKYNLGFRTTGDTSGALPMISHFIVGTAVVPNELISDAFENALKDANGYTPSRDTPNYVSYQVIRADVTDRSVDQLEEPDEKKIAAGQGDWVFVTRHDLLLKYAKNWTGIPGEVITPKYYDEKLTSPLPPLLMKDYLPFASHALVPLSGEGDDEKDDEEEQPEEDGEEETGEDPTFGSDLTADAIQASSGRNRGGANGMGAPGSEYGEESMGSEGGESAMGSEYGGMGGGMAGYEGGMGGAAYGGLGAPVVIPSEYKLIRFYDFRGNPRVNKNSAQPGRKYVYRVSVAIEDPNYPINKNKAPKQSTLDDEVLSRVQALEISDAKTKQGRRTGWIWTAWSEPSSPISLPRGNEFAIGGAEPPSKELNFNGFRFPKDPVRRASLVSAQFNFRYGTEITAQFDKATVGTVLDKIGFEDEIVDPSSLEIYKLPNASLKSGGIVLGIQGGETLMTSEMEEEKDDEEIDPLTVPAEILLFDSNGNLVVRNEIDDAFKYREYTFADEYEKAKAAKAAASAAATMTSDDDEMGGGENFFGEG